MTNLLLALVMLTNFLLVGTGRISKAISVAALQGAILGLLMLVVHHDWKIHVVLVAVATMVFKGLVIPAMLRRALYSVKIRREVEPYVGFIASLVLCSLGTGLAMLMARILPMAEDAPSTLIVPAGLATLFTGLLLLVTRRKAITQVVGYLVLENGIFVFGLLLIEEMPLLVEAGVLLDLMVCIFVMAIVINHIQREFDSLDTGKLAELKD
jgi:hydrogenase-4 component E